MDGHVEQIGKKRTAYRVLAEKLKGNDHFEDVGVYRRIISKSILKDWNGVWTGLIFVRTHRSVRLLSRR
jgi:hypothetical protein